MTTDLFHPLHSHGIGDSSLFISRPFEKSPLASFAEGNCFPGANVHSREKGACVHAQNAKKNLPRPVRTALPRMGWSFSVFCYFLPEDAIVYPSNFTLTVPCPLCWVQVNNAFTQSRLRFSSYNIILTSSLQCSKKKKMDCWLWFPR